MCSLLFYKISNASGSIILLSRDLIQELFLVFTYISIDVEYEQPPSDTHKTSYVLKKLLLLCTTNKANDYLN